MSQHLSTNKSDMQKVGVQFYIVDSTVSRPHCLPVYVRECKILPGKRTVCTANWAVLLHCTAYCCRSSTDYSSVMHTDEHLEREKKKKNHAPSPSQLGLISTGDQLAIHHTAPSTLFWPQYHKLAVLEHTLSQRAQFTVWYSPQERLHTTPGTHAQNKETLKKQSKPREGEVKLHSSFNRTVILNVVSWRNYCQTVAIIQNVTVTATVPLLSGKKCSFWATVQVNPQSVRT